MISRTWRTSNRRCLFAVYESLVDFYPSAAPKGHQRLARNRLRVVTVAPGSRAMCEVHMILLLDIPAYKQLPS